MGDTDIETFIAHQKAKLAVERQNLNDNKMNLDEYQRDWQQMHAGKNLKGLDLSVDLSPRIMYPEYEKSLEKENYKKQWYDIKGRYMEPGSQRKGWNEPTDLKLSPRGLLDTDALINKVQKEREKEEYEAQWRKIHKVDNQASSPRRQANNMPARLDTDRVIQNVVNEPSEEFIIRKRADAKSGLNNLNPLNPASATPMSKEQYRRNWEQKNSQRGYGNVPSLKDQTDEFKAGTLPGNESDSVKWQQRKQRNDEYNQFLATKNQGRRNGGPGQSDFTSSLPRLNYSNSAQKRQMEDERNKEYNEMLQQKAQQGSRRRGGGGAGGPPADVRTGWGTPDYGDILAKQRAKEQNYRRANDIGFASDPVNRQNNSNGSQSVRRSKDQGGEYFASLPIGRGTDSAKQRQKSQYSNDLKQQMAEAAQARHIERKEGLLVNSNNVITAPLAQRQPAPRHQPTFKADPYYSYLKEVPDYDQLSPRSNAILGRRQPTSERLSLRDKGGINPSLTPRANNVGTLDLGILSQPRTTSLDPPAGLLYQPS